MKSVTTTKMKSAIIKKTILFAMLSWFTCSSNGDVIYHFEGVEYKGSIFAGVPFSSTSKNVTQAELDFSDEPRIVIRYYVVEDVETSGCTGPPEHFIIKPYNNGSLITNEVVFTQELTGFNIGFYDTTYSTPETHEYKLEFYECEEYCELNEYSKARDKFGEITVTLNYTP